MNFYDLLGYLAIVLGLIALWLAPRHRIGWMISALITFLWGAYAIDGQRWPMLVNTCVFGAISFRNWWIWKEPKS